MGNDILLVDINCIKENYTKQEYEAVREILRSLMQYLVYGEEDTITDGQIEVALYMYKLGNIRGKREVRKKGKIQIL